MKMADRYRIDAFKTTKAMRDEWRSIKGSGMTSAVGEYTPAEFWDLLDDYERLVEYVRKRSDKGSPYCREMLKKVLGEE